MTRAHISRRVEVRTEETGETEGGEKGKGSKERGDRPGMERQEKWEK